MSALTHSHVRGPLFLIFSSLTWAYTLVHEDNLSSSMWLRMHAFERECLYKRTICLCASKFMCFSASTFYLDLTFYMQRRTVVTYFRLAGSQCEARLSSHTCMHSHMSTHLPKLYAAYARNPIIPLHFVLSRVKCNFI